MWQMRISKKKEKVGEKQGRKSKKSQNKEKSKQSQIQVEGIVRPPREWGHSQEGTVVAREAIKVKT